MIYVSEIGTPLGPLGLAECRERFLAVWPGGLSSVRFRELGIENLGALVFAEEVRPLSQRFAAFLAGGARGRFSVDLSLAKDPLSTSIYRTLFRTRAGEILTLREVAERVGPTATPGAVEEAVRNNPLLGVVPTHRVREAGVPLGIPEDQAWARFFSGLAGEARDLD